jgi:predicted ribosomally synthesized peptide with SipW-like signal peptide
MTLWTKRRSRAILLVLVVVALATAGVVYAHWTDTLQVNAQISTGNVEMIVGPANTDDDHVNNTWEIIRETAAQEGTNYDRWVGTSSNDPGTYLAGTRYDKDVAGCWVTGISPDKHTVSVLIDNAYPSYHCTIRTAISVTGSVPVRNQAARVWACLADCGNPASWVAVPYVRATNSFSYNDGIDPDFELVMQDAPGGVCGYQFDPGDQSVWTVGLHILQGAAQGTTYQVRFALEEVNWNEWSLANCVGFSNQPQP